MFAYVFGGAIALLGGGNYHEYLIGGMLGMGLAQTAPGVAVALVTAQMPARVGVTTDVVRALDSAGIRVTDVTLRRSSLDDVFMILTGHRTAPEQAAADGDAGQQADTEQGGAAA